MFIWIFSSMQATYICCKVHWGERVISINTYIFDLKRDKVNITDEKAISISSDYQMRNNSLLEGFIHITYYDQSVISEEHCDDVELMWIGFLRMTLQYLENGYGETSYFIHNQTWKMETIHTRKEKQVLFRIINNKMEKFLFDERIFMKELIKSAEEFTSFVSMLAHPNSITVLAPLLKKMINISID